MGDAHPEIAWGCEAVKRFTGTWANTSKMWYSSKASHIITIKVGDDLSFRIFAMQCKDDYQLVEGLWARISSLETKIKEHKNNEAELIQLKKIVSSMTTQQRSDMKKYQTIIQQECEISKIATLEVLRVSEDIRNLKEANSKEL